MQDPVKKEFSMGLGAVRPINEPQEKKKFLKKLDLNETYNPKFKYKSSVDSGHEIRTYENKLSEDYLKLAYEVLQGDF